VARVFSCYWGGAMGVDRGEAKQQRRERRARAKAAKKVLAGGVRRRLQREPISADPPLDPLSLADLVNALHVLATTAPGPDGLPAGFHRTMQCRSTVDGQPMEESYLGYFHRVYLAGGALRELHETARQAAIILLAKAGDNFAPANYRPIARLNVDYKILAKAWSQKLALWLPTAIDPDQAGFVPGRDIATNI
ncbi:unnamed protein product, partial [Phaeothamnion confervicola]